MESAIFFRLNLQLIFCSIEAYFIFFLLILSPLSFLLLCFLLSLISFTHQYHLSLSNTVSLSLFLFPFKTVSHFLYCILTFSVLLAAIFENSIWSMYQLISPFIYVFFCLCSLHLGCASSLSRVQLCETPWTVAHQTPLSLEFSRQVYWSGLPFHSSRRSSQTQGSNPHLLCLLHLQTGSLLNQGGSPFSTFSCYKFTCDKICLLVSLHSFSSHQYVSPLFFYFKILFLIDNTFCYCIFMDNAIYLKLFYIIFN